MVFLKRQFPLLICFALGVAMAVQFYVPTTFSQKVSITLADWYVIMAMFAQLLGLVSVFLVHGGKVGRQGTGWGYSALMFAGFAIMLVVGLVSKGQDVTADGKATPQTWFYVNMLVPLQATMFSMLGFYVTSAAFRSFRAKSKEAGVLLAAALIVLVANVPFSNHIWAQVFGIHDVAGVPMEMPDIKGWLLSTPNAAARRGVGFGVALGAIATSLKIIFGIERAYLGGGD